jgi:ABC-type multidrug transport system fused ATPase/permease subunit
MEDGQLVESGTHEELLSHQGIYASLWQVQMGQRDVITPVPRL